MLAVLLPLLFACPDGMVEIAAGTWTFGVENADTDWQEPPAERLVDGFCMDRFEYPNERGVLPRVEVSWKEASELCAAQDKRLCTSDEWERGCRGPAGSLYAYGAAFDRGLCNTPIDGGGPGPDGPPIAASGAHPGCRSMEEVFDLNGNVSEWVADAWDADRFGPALGQGPGAGSKKLRELRGGTMWGGTFYGQSCLSRHAHPASTLSDDDGFRCCATPAPSQFNGWVGGGALLILLAWFRFKPR